MQTDRQTVERGGEQSRYTVRQAAKRVTAVEVTTSQNHVAIS